MSRVPYSYFALVPIESELLDGEDSLHSDQDFYWREFAEFGLLNYGLDHIRHGREGFGQLGRRSLLGRVRPSPAETGECRVW